MNKIVTDIIPADWPLWSATKPTLRCAITGGLTNKSFLLTTAGGDVVLRINSAHSSALNLNRNAEHQALRLADKAGLCAPLIHYDRQHKYMVSRFIRGESWNSSATNLAQLAQHLQKIHRLPPIDAHLIIADKIAHYWRGIKSDSNAGFIKQLHSLHQRIHVSIDKASALSQGNCLCHNDLLADNLITTSDGKLYVIDWEYAAMGDPFYDLAVITEGHNLNQQQQHLLLTSYLSRPANAPDWQRLYLCQLVYCYLTALWYAVQWSAGAMDEPVVSSAITQQIDRIAALMANMPRSSANATPLTNHKKSERS